MALSEDAARQLHWMFQESHELLRRIWSGLSREQRGSGVLVRYWECPDIPDKVIMLPWEAFREGKISVLREQALARPDQIPAGLFTLIDSDDPELDCIFSLIAPALGKRERKRQERHQRRVQSAMA